MQAFTMKVKKPNLPRYYYVFPYIFFVSVNKKQYCEKKGGLQRQPKFAFKVGYDLVSVEGAKRF